MIPPVLLVALLVIGLIVGVVVVQQRQTLQSKASADQVQFGDYRIEGDKKIIDSAQVDIQLNAPWAAAGVQSAPASKPSSLSASCLGNNQVRINWDQVDGATSYKLRLNNITKSGWSGSCESPSSNHDFCRDLELNRYFFNYETGDNYEFWVHAVNARGESPASDHLNFVCPSAGGGGGSGSSSNGMLGMVLGAAAQLAQAKNSFGEGTDTSSFGTGFGSEPYDQPTTSGDGWGEPAPDTGTNDGSPTEYNEYPTDENRNPTVPTGFGDTPDFDENPGSSGAPSSGSGDGGVVAAVGGVIQSACELVGLCNPQPEPEPDPEPASGTVPVIFPPGINDHTDLGGLGGSTNPGSGGTTTPVSNDGGNSGSSGNSGNNGAPSQPSVRTTGYRLADDPAVLQNTPFRPYGRNGLKVVFNFSDQTNGTKTIFVQFQNSQGGVSEPRAYSVELRTAGSPGATTTTNPGSTANGPTAVISGPTTSTVGQPVTFTATINNDLDARDKLWIAKDGGTGPVRVTSADVEGFTGIFNCDNAANPNCGWYRIGVGSGSQLHGTVKIRTAGTYKVIADVTDSSGRTCSSNPYVTYNPTYVTGGITFYRCGDPVTLTVNP